jgi:HEPN domain-containing protein
MENKLSLVQNWFRKAESDLRNVEIIFRSAEEDKPFDTVCFHCQQAVEKYLKGFLVFLDMKVIKTHNIEVLIDLISAKYPDVEIFESAVILTNYAIESRYPDDFVEIAEEEAKEAYEIALRIKSFVINKLNELPNLH